MKTIEIEMGEFLGEKAGKPIRSKKDIILLLLETLKFLERPEESSTDQKGKIILYIDKMSRIFFSDGR